MKCFLVLLSFVLVFTRFAYAAKLKNLPSSFQQCSNSTGEAEYDYCFNRAVNNAFPQMKNGLPSLRVSPTDPLEVTEFSLRQDEGSRSVQLSITFTNAKFIGFSNTKFSKTHFGRGINGNVNMEVEGFIPEVQIIAHYKMEGKILILPIVGEGMCNITMSQVQIQTQLKNEIVKRNGEDHLKVNEFNNDIRPKHVYLQFENLFGGDAALGREMNRFMNENSDLIYEELKPAVEETFGAVCQQISNQLFLRVPYNNIFPQ